MFQNKKELKCLFGVHKWTWTYSFKTRQNRYTIYKRCLVCNSWVDSNNRNDWIGYPSLREAKRIIDARNKKDGYT